MSIQSLDCLYTEIWELFPFRLLSERGETRSGNRTGESRARARGSELRILKSRHDVI